MNLLEWTSIHIDSRNAFKKNLVKKNKDSNNFVCEYTDIEKHTYVVESSLESSVLERISEGNITLVCLNSKKNLDFLIKNWDDFIKNPKLKIMFVNPKMNVQWSLMPYNHNRIADPKSLKKGLKSIAESVPFVK